MHTVGPFANLNVPVVRVGHLKTGSTSKKFPWVRCLIQVVRWASYLDIWEFACICEHKLKSALHFWLWDVAFGSWGLSFPFACSPYMHKGWVQYDKDKDTRSSFTFCMIGFSSHQHLPCVWPMIPSLLEISFGKSSQIPFEELQIFPHWKDQS